MAKQPANHPFASRISKPDDERANARTTKARREFSHSHYHRRKTIESINDQRALEREFELDYEYV